MFWWSLKDEAKTNTAIPQHGHDQSSGNPTLHLIQANRLGSRTSCNRCIHQWFHWCIDENKELRLDILLKDLDTDIIAKASLSIWQTLPMTLFIVSVLKCCPLISQGQSSNVKVMNVFLGFSKLCLSACAYSSCKIWNEDWQKDTKSSKYGERVRWYKEKKPNKMLTEWNSVGHVSRSGIIIYEMLQGTQRTHEDRISCQ